MQAQELKSNLKRNSALIKRQVSFSADTKGWGQEKALPSIPIIKETSPRFKCTDVTGVICSLGGSLLALHGATMSLSDVFPATILLVSGMCCLIGGSYALMAPKNHE